MKVPQVRPDWFQRYTSIDEAEKNLPDFKFEGWGFYLEKDSFLLILPPGEEIPSWDEPGEGVGFWAYGWDVPFNETILGNRLRDIPVRKVPVKE